MPVVPNSKLGPYEIKSSLGSGGMGEVFRARDTRLDRDVALKIMHQDSAAELRQRFEREAHTVAALNHPNIVAVFDFGIEGNTQYVVSELVEGETLRVLIRSGPVPTRKLVDIATQLADGLAAAHAAGIVHRDLKPENVMLTRNGRVKILDFGLARRNPLFKTSITSPTLGLTQASAHLTDPGAILGTVHYMSPEQATGGDTDFRADQFSFGLILYELASGKQAFACNSAVETLAAIVRDEPLPLEAKVPPPLHWIIDRCLSKEPQNRYDSTRDLYHDLKSLRDHLSDAYSSAELAPIAAPAITARKPWLLAVLVVAAMLLAGSIGYIAKPSGADINRYQFTPFAFNTAPGRAAWSPDGQAVAYNGSVDGVSQVFVRYLNSPVPLQLTHTAGSAEAVGWSSDGAHVIVLVFDISHATASISSISRFGGEAELMLDASTALSADVSRDGKKLAVFMFDPRQSNYSVWLSDPIGSPLKPYSPAPFITKNIYNEPGVEFSPDGATIFLYRLGDSSHDEAWLLPLPAGRAAPHRILTTISSHGETPNFSWMPDGRHVVLALATRKFASQRLWLADTESNALAPITAGTTAQSSPSVSPDGKSIAFTEARTTIDIVSASLQDGSISSLVSTGREESMPAWAGKADKLAFVSKRSGALEIWVRDADGTQHPVVTARDFPQPIKFFADPVLSPDGGRIIYVAIPDDGKAQLWMSSLTGGPPVRVTNATGEDEFGGSWSPDGSRFAYTSVKGGNTSLMLVRVIANASPTLIKAQPGESISFIPAWSPDGKRLTYHDESGWRLVATDGKREQALANFNSDGLVFSQDGNSLYGIAVSGNEQSLFRYDLASAKLTTIKKLDRSQRPFESGARFSLAPDGKSIAYSIGERKLDLWMLEGFQPPGWWATLKGMF